MAKLSSQILLYLVAFTFGGSMAYWQGGEPGRRTPNEVHEEKWVLSEVSTGASAKQAYQSLVKLAPWGSRKSDTHQPDVSWEYVGTSIDNDTHYALIKRNKAILRFAVGDVLPDGSRVNAIERDFIEIESSYGLQKVRLFE